MRFSGLGGCARSLVLLFICINAVTGTPAMANEPVPVPASAFASLPAFDDPALSPNGKNIAYAIQKDGKVHIISQDLAGANRKLIPPIKDGSIDSFLWANDDVLLVKFSGTVDRWAFRGKSHETRAVAFDLSDKGEPRWLGKPKSNHFGVGNSELLSQFETIVDLLPDDPEHILMTLDFDLNGAPAVFKVDVRSGSRGTVHRGRSDIQHWYTDQKAEVRLGVGIDDDGPIVMLKGLDGKWQNLEKVEWAKRVDVEGFSDDPRYLYVSGRSKHGTEGLYVLDLQTGQIVETLFENEKYDSEGFVEHPVTGHLAGFRYRDDFWRTQFIDKDLDILQRSLERALPDAIVSIVSKARNQNLYIILAKSDRNPGHYYLYDRDNKQLEFIASRRPDLDDVPMGATQAVSIPMRDGTTIPGYLTLPPGRDTAAGLPAVIMPHGGPIGIRDDAEWDWWAQFIANRGYAVLKPNYRGSGGYGYPFRHIGRNQWGGLMQDDVTDATRWLIKEKAVDKDRLCIVGASYGGYAALMGVIKEPGLYKCAVSVNGVTDIPDMKRFDKGFIGGDYWVQFMGLSGADDKEVSPTRRVKDVSAPVLLISAEDDTTVPYKQSRDMDKALRKLKKPSRYVEMKTGTHHMVTSESRLTVLEETEKFLAAYLK